MSEHKENRVFRCAVCETAEITESHTVVPPSGIDDRYLTGGCDYNSYKDYEVTGGVLFDDRPGTECNVVRWHWVADWGPILDRKRRRELKTPPIGGICNSCLKNAVVKALLPRLRGLKIK